ncbi:DUF6252 family protein [Flavobacterium sp. N3904]|uniref:DUF6252 family protein n=1 Tax=Flavobacterium sp. N3904 TaxID=2986835 RepID=UPI0022246B06|nr:DUF6252 family protein [Flavobacterium sp. N3904]
MTRIKNNGQGGISSRIDGSIVKPKGGGIYGNIHCLFAQDSNGQDYFTIGYSNDKNNTYKSIRIVALNINYLTMAAGRVFDLATEKNSESYAEYTLTSDNFNEDRYKTNSIQKGELKILFYDKDRRIITGTFWFDAINSDGKIVKVTAGRFDTTVN